MATSYSKTVTKSETTGGQKTYASGYVDETTRANKELYGKDYQESANVTNIYNKLQNKLNNEPGAFSSPYMAQLDTLYNKIVNREKFNYNFNADPVYQQYKANYISGGKNAMKDTVAQTTALTGGYSNSYAQTAGQQTYQQYLHELNNIIPQLEQQNYQRYQDEGNNLQNQYNLASDRYNKDYQTYRDTVADYKADRDYLSNLYQQERSFDYGKYTANRQYWNDEFWKQRNSESTTDTWSNTTSTSETTTKTSGGGGGSSRSSSNSGSSKIKPLTDKEKKANASTRSPLTPTDIAGYVKYVKNGGSTKEAWQSRLNQAVRNNYFSNNAAIEVAKQLDLVY